jgi:type II secretory pathway pseudopilin PulG
MEDYSAAPRRHRGKYVMRLIVDILVVLMLMGILAGVVMHNRQARYVQDQRELARAELERFQQHIHYQAVASDAAAAQPRYPESIDPEWFGGRLPRNPLLPEGHPWVEVGSSGRKTAEHPASLIATDLNVAQFWYNPHTGIVRARVPAGISDAEALDLYNAVNSCALTSLFSTK